MYSADNTSLNDSTAPSSSNIFFSDSLGSSYSRPKRLPLGDMARNYRSSSTFASRAASRDRESSPRAATKDSIVDSLRSRREQEETSFKDCLMSG